MTQRITTQMTASMTLADLSAAMNRLSNTQAQLASGKRITKPSDDPYGASLAVQLNSQLASLDAYNRSVNDGTAWTQTADSALMGVNNMAQRVRELVVAASNGTSNASNLASDAAEVDQLISAVKESANTEYDGQYVFSGTATTTQPYPSSTDVYQGNSSTVNRQIGPGNSNLIPVNTDISQLMGSGPTVAGDTGLLTTLRTISQDMKSGNTANLGNDLSSLDANLTTLQSLEANVGATESRLQLASSRIQDLQFSATQQLSNTQDVDMAQATIDYSTEQASYTAALQASAKIVQQSLLSFLQ